MAKGKLMIKKILPVVAILTVWSAGLQVQQRAPAERVLINGQVLTVDANDSVAEAVAIAGGRIVAVGSTADIRSWIGGSTEVIDLRGRTATPGLIDTHVHFTEVAGLYSVELSSVKNLDEVLKLVAAQVAKSKPGEWVRGLGWDEGKLAERRYITAADLDKVAPDNPVWLEHTTGHYGVANSYAMKMAEVRKDIQDPPAGTIDRDAQGAPSGVMKESAQSLITRLVPPYTVEQERNGLSRMVADFNKEGMTGAKDPGIGPQKWDLYNEMLRSGKLTVRMFALWSGPRSAEGYQQLIARLASHPRPPASLGDGVLFSGGIKMFMDGSGGARTAWMHEDWNRNYSGKDTGNKGYPAIAPDAYRTVVNAFHDAGLHVSTHAIGDRAIDWVVDTYAAALQRKPTRGLRHGIIHDNTPTDHAIDLMARLQREYDAGYPESQAEFTWWIGDNYAGNLGAERGQRLNPFHTYITKNIRWAGGSDYPVTPYPARYGLWASVTRKTLNGTYGATPFGTAEAVDVHTALRSYTAWAAHQIFSENRVGSIEVGKDADIAVWDRNMYTVAADELRNLNCEMTLFRGKVVYKR